MTVRALMRTRDRMDQAPVPFCCDKTEVKGLCGTDIPAKSQIGRPHPHHVSRIHEIPERAAAGRNSLLHRGHLQHLQTFLIRINRKTLVLIQPECVNRARDRIQYFHLHNSGKPVLLHFQILLSPGCLKNLRSKRIYLPLPVRF